MVEEFASSNFAGISKNKESGKWKYSTPYSKSILNSITNRSLFDLARSLGWETERELIPWSRVVSGEFDEVLAVGTAVICTPIGEIHRQSPLKGKEEEADPWCLNESQFGASSSVETEIIQISGGEKWEGSHLLYDGLKRIQRGEDKDRKSWKWMWPEEGL